MLPPPPSLSILQVIDAGKFDLVTSNEERKVNLEQLLQDESRNQVARNDVLSMKELNRAISRGEDEAEQFEKWDTELFWPVQQPLERWEELPEWMRFTPRQLTEATAATSKVQRRDRLTTHEEQKRKEAAVRLGWIPDLSFCCFIGTGDWRVVLLVVVGGRSPSEPCLPSPVPP